MGVEGLAREQNEGQGEVVYETPMDEVSDAMRKLGYEGFFNVSVEDDGISYLVSANAKMKGGTDPLDALPTMVALPKEQYSLEDAQKTADEMRVNLLKGEIE